MLVPMRRIEIMAPRRDGDELLRSLHRTGTVQLIPYRPGSSLAATVFASAGAMAGVARWEDLHGQVAALSEALGSGAARPSLIAELWSLDEPSLRRRAAAELAVRDRLTELQTRRQGLLSEHARLVGYRRIVESLRPVVGRLPSLRGYGSSALVIRARYRSVLPALRDELEVLTDGRCEMIAADIEGDRVAALLIYPQGTASTVQALLGGRDLEEVTLPQELVGLPFDELVVRLGRRIEGGEEDLSRVGGELADLAARHGPRLAALQAVIGDRMAEARALRGAGTSDHLLVLSGWVPADALPALRERLASDVGDQVWIEERETTAAESAEAPVVVRNGPLVQPFARLASFVSLPRYGTLDPTPTLAITLPIFIGLMVGDVGYGLILLALILLARRRWREKTWIGVVTTIGVVTGLSTILFGFLFGEAFGDAGHELIGMRPILFDRQEAVAEFLVLALAIGVAQVGLGVVLGIVNSALGHRSRELAGRIGLLVLLVASVVAVGWLAGVVPTLGGQLALVVLAVAVAVLIGTLGLAGPIEAIGMLGNVLSYARIMAIGMASVMLAITANRLGGVAGSVLVGVLIAGLVHAVNLVLGFFDSSVQGLRLHYVEFFGKFVESGGTRYAPFASSLPLPVVPPTQEGGS